MSADDTEKSFLENDAILFAPHHYAAAFIHYEIQLYLFPFQVLPNILISKMKNRRHGQIIHCVIRDLLIEGWPF